jgi:hypothetical protein
MSKDAHLYSRIYVCLDLFPPAKAKAIWTAAQHRIRQDGDRPSDPATRAPADTVAVWRIDRINRT